MRRIALRELPNLGVSCKYFKSDGWIGNLGLVVGGQLLTLSMRVKERYIFPCPIHEGILGRVGSIIPLILNLRTS